MTLAAERSLFAWHPHPDVWLFVGLLAVGYAWALRRASRPDANAPAATRKQITLFYTGVLVLWLSADWPMHDIAERSLFSVHMVQHLLLTFVVPPLLLLGTPKWLLRKLLARPLVHKVARFFTKPLIAMILFNGVILVTHWPLIVDASIESTFIHGGVHYLLIGSAVAMWWCVIAPLPEMPSLSDPAKMLYLFLQSVLPTVPASFLTFATAPIYHSYEGLNHLGGLSTVDDQQIAGLIMKIGGGLLLWGVIAYIFFTWNKKEEAGTVDEASWEDFERDLQAWELRT